MSDHYQIVGMTDLLNKTASWNVYKRGTVGKALPVATGFATRKLAEEKIRELEATESHDA